MTTPYISSIIIAAILAASIFISLRERGDIIEKMKAGLATAVMLSVSFVGLLLLFIAVGFLANEIQSLVNTGRFSCPSK